MTTNTPPKPPSAKMFGERLLHIEQRLDRLEQTLPRVQGDNLYITAQPHGEAVGIYIGDRKTSQPEPTHKYVAKCRLCCQPLQPMDDPDYCSDCAISEPEPKVDLGEIIRLLTSINKPFIPGNFHKVLDEALSILQAHQRTEQKKEE